MSPGPAARGIGWRAGLSDDEQRKVRELIAAAATVDSVAPVGDQVLRELPHDRAKHLLAVDGDAVSGYLSLTDAPAPAAALALIVGRDLLQMRRPLTDLPAATVPEGVRIATYSGPADDAE